MAQINGLQQMAPYKSTDYSIRSYDAQKSRLNTSQNIRRVNLAGLQNVELSNKTGIIPRAITRYDQMVERIANRRLETIENATLRKTFRSDLRAYRTIQYNNALSIGRNNNLVNLLA
jgi:hypothetical protein